MTDESKSRGIRYLLILIVYNFIIAVTAYIISWVNDTFLHYTIANWEMVDWYLFIGSLILVGAVFLYLAPFFEKKLYYTLELKIRKQVEKYEKNARSNEGEI